MQQHVEIMTAAIKKYKTLAIFFQLEKQLAREERAPQLLR